VPEKSPESIVRKHAKRKEATRLRLKLSDLPMYKISARRMRPKLGQMTKAELRDMLTAAVRNT
jgi:hypothetical protein